MKNIMIFDGFDLAKVWKQGEYSGYPEHITSSDSRYLNSDLVQNIIDGMFYGEGSGTKEDPYIIKTESQFLQIAQERQKEFYYRLEADLDLTALTVGEQSLTEGISSSAEASMTATMEPGGMINIKKVQTQLRKEMPLPDTLMETATR